VQDLHCSILGGSESHERRISPGAESYRFPFGRVSLWCDSQYTHRRPAMGDVLLRASPCCGHPESDASARVPSFHSTFRDRRRLPLGPATDDSISVDFGNIIHRIEALSLQLSEGRDEEHSFIAPFQALRDAMQSSGWEAHEHETSRFAGAGIMNRLYTVSPWSLR
jgi:hypothetical protein